MHNMLCVFNRLAYLHYIIVTTWKNFVNRQRYSWNSFWRA